VKLGIIGLPNVGKSTLFNAITRAHAEVANYPFCTIDPNIGTVCVPDNRLNTLKKIYKAKKTIPAFIEFVDIAGIVKNASNGEGLGNQFLAHIKEASAIIHIVRCFNDANIVNVMDTVNPIRDIDIVNTELILSDIMSISKKLEKLEKLLRFSQSNSKIVRELILAKKIKDHLNSGKTVNSLELDDDEKIILKDFFLISSKPVLYVCNISENDLPLMRNKYTEAVKEKLKYERSGGTISLCVKIEAELSEFHKIDQEIFLKNLGMKELGLNGLIRAGYNLLNLITFFTAGNLEIKAWTIKNGILAQQAAGIIHSDFDRGFIRAKVLNFNDLFKFGDEKIAKNAGLLKNEGKKYLIKDGDIIEFVFAI
jgi:GTP-binding protein YchF